MSIFYPVEQFFQASGNAAAVFGEQLRDGIATFACNLWELYPNFITQSSLPAASFSRGFMNQMCSPIQPPVIAPSQTFTGGQCVGLNYTILVQFFFSDASTKEITLSLFGPISTLQGWLTPAGAGWIMNGRGEGFDINGDPAVSVNQGGPVFGTPTTVGFVLIPNGGPDVCGDPPINYNSPQPTSSDLQTVINITNLDGLDNSFDLVFNKVSNNYNFPMSFKLNGVNVVLDVGGITIFGNPTVNKPSTPANRTDNDPEKPGTDGGNDGVGGDNNTVYDNDYPTLPDITAPETALEVLEWLICIDGVITVVTDTLKVVTGNGPVLNLIIDLVGDILEEICEGGGGDEVAPIVGFPEWYGIRPGTDRPAIVYLWKEFINNTWQPSTYSSTVSHPTAAAVADINTIVVPDKTMGTWVASLTLTDGSRIRTSGDTEVVALNNFNFLLNQVEPAFIPADVNTKIILSENQQLQVKTVKLRQIEYYPTGGGVNKSPTIRRVIDA